MNGMEERGTTAVDGKSRGLLNGPVFIGIVERHAFITVRLEKVARLASFYHMQMNERKRDSH